MRKSLMRMTLRQLQIFNEVCDLRSYSRAAEEMSLTQPAVSLQIRQLEELIGQPLFDYVGKKLYMTEAAEALQRASRDIFGRLENLDMQLSDMQGSLQGQLKLAVESSAKYFVPHLFAAFKRQHPEVQLQLTVVNRAQVIQQEAEETKRHYQEQLAQSREEAAALREHERGHALLVRAREARQVGGREAAISHGSSPRLQP